MKDAAPAAGAAVDELLGAAGPIAARLPGFAVRHEQQDMARAVAAALAAREVLVCEAGTGTGKTLAYLVPALASGLRTVVSTATRTLQDQLFHRDLPLVLEALPGRRRVALLKGRQNYLCQHRLQRALDDPATDYRRLPLLQHLARWARNSASGDLEEVGVLGDEAGLRAQVTSTTENCLGQECPLYGDCFVVRARRAAAEAEVVVVNHHLLFADLVLREGGFAELLPHAEAVVLDEAHKVPDIASNFFGRALSGQQIGAFCHEAQVVAAADAADMPALARALLRFDHAQLALREVLQPLARRSPWRAVSARAAVGERIEAAGVALETVLDALGDAAARSPDLDRMHERAVDLAERWSLFAPEADQDCVRWLDTSARNFTVYETPISIANEFSQRVAKSEAAWILTSATLAVDGRFEHFTRALGLEGVRTALWQSPFDYQRQSLLYVPPLTVIPGAADFERGLLDAVLPVLAASGGRAFLLFTSYRALDRVAAMLDAESDYPLLIQGSAPRRALLERFLATPRAVLLGTASFWEGIDVRGDRLSCVVIDKLPFGVPDDPVTRARADALRAQGEDPFEALQLPEAVTALKQGAGRLIRDVTDRGVLVICDTRLLSRGYGRAFLRSLPPMPLTRTIAEVESFYREEASTDGYEVAQSS